MHCGLRWIKEGEIRGHGACSMHGRDKKCTQQFRLKPEEKRPLRRTRPKRGIILKCTDILKIV
jgi:hypothetical protein